MNDDKSAPDLDQLDARIAQARKRGDEDREASEMSGFGAAMRYGTELVAGLIVGVGIGLFLDNWLDTGPWFLVVFFFLGAGAGILNVYRTASGIGLATGYRVPGQDDAPDEKTDANQKTDEK